eukprot:GFKZ01003217.1.p1 GENE.GFKZ01003217.1~~GFKZ01003217.1.p1  ORF type:complete len:434 (+),score=60.16 GFKZ01003217.1:111-1304(+)
MPSSRDSSLTPAGDAAAAASTAAMLHKANLINEALTTIYPDPPAGFLHHTNPFTLLIAVLLSAQSLDSQVNKVTPNLFHLADTPEKMRALGEDQIRALIKQIGLAPQKAKNICKLSHAICDNFDGKVPDTFKGLESLAGVGHKTASVVMMQAFDTPAFPVDTHIHRLACRWGCGDPKSVEKTEAALKTWFPDPSSWGQLHVRMILFGREYCPARKHNMDQCPICRFAATVESRRANDIHQNKFVAALRHRDPYSVREVPEAGRGAGVTGSGSEEDEGDEEEYVPDEVGKRAKSGAGQSRRRGVRGKRGDGAQGRRVAKGGKGDAVGTRRSARLGKRQNGSAGVGVEGGEEGAKKRRRSAVPTSRHAEGDGRGRKDVEGGGARGQREGRGLGQEIDVK